MMMAVFSLFLLLLSSSASADVRAVMEGVKTSNNTVFIDTVNSRVGIKTTAPATALDIFGAAQFGNGTTRSTFTAAGNLTMPKDGGLYFQDSTFADSRILTFNTGSAETCIGDAVVSNCAVSVRSGRMGIGTTAPATTLDVFGAAQFGNGTTRSTFTAAGNLTMPKDGGLYFQDSTFADSRILTFNTGSAETCIGDAVVSNCAVSVRSGKMGIGTTAPAVELDVVGAAQFGNGTTRSTFTAAGALTLASGAKITQSGAAGYFNNVSSVTASGFFGDGNNVTNLKPGNLAGGSNAVCTASQYLGGVTYSQGTATNGTCTGAGTGDVLLASTQTFTGANTFISSATFTGFIQVSTFGGFGYGAQGNTLNIMQDYIWATSIDGAQQSSGCIVFVNAASSDSGSQFQFTSTTTAGLNLITSGVIAGMLLETCATAKICRVGLRGMYRMQSGGALAQQFLSASDTRCRLRGDNAQDASAFGYPLTSATLNNGDWFWGFIWN